MVIDLPWEAAVKRTTDALKQEGFGVLTEIDVRRTMKEKIAVDYEPYVILGACNPGLAHRALTAERDLGLLLPCNVVVRAVDETRTSISALDPEAALGVAGIEVIAPIAHEARKRLERVIDSLRRESNGGAA
jgi:uncharacterized protein (DUF302 family)